MFNQKILVIGNETIDTDIKVSELARKSNTINHGLLVDSKLEFINIGYYHTSVYDGMIISRFSNAVNCNFVAKV